MSKNKQASPPITEQIYEVMLAELANHEAFDLFTIERIQDLVAQGSLTNQTRVLRAIECKPEEKK